MTLSRVNQKHFCSFREGRKSCQVNQECFIWPRAMCISLMLYIRKKLNKHSNISRRIFYGFCCCCCCCFSRFLFLQCLHLECLEFLKNNLFSWLWIIILLRNLKFWCIHYRQNILFWCTLQTSRKQRKWFFCSE